MKIKVCGMRQEANLEGLCQFPIDFVGFIFYNKSPRFVTELPAIMIPKNIKKVGVFVNATVQEIVFQQQVFGLDYIQLHGTESSSFCALLKRKGCKIIKAFSVDASFNFGQLEAYEDACDFFLLDTKGAAYGGNGVTFDWSILERYYSKKPFFLSGGIELEHVEAIQQLKISQLYAVDINSKFELEPALKDLKKVEQFVGNLKQSKNEHSI